MLQHVSLSTLCLPYIPSNKKVLTISSSTDSISVTMLRISGIAPDPYALTISTITCCNLVRTTNSQTMSSNNNLNQISGYLKVKGTWGSYNKFWFVIKDHTLYRYKSQKETIVPQETLDMSKHVSVMRAEGITYVCFLHNCFPSGKKLTIGIFVASKSPIILYTANDEEFSLWLERLQHACAKDANKKQDSTESIVATMVRPKFSHYCMVGGRLGSQCCC